MPKELAAIGPWAPYRSVAAWYLSRGGALPAGDGAGGRQPTGAAFPAPRCAMVAADEGVEGIVLRELPQ